MKVVTYLNWKLCPSNCVLSQQMTHFTSPWKAVLLVLNTISEAPPPSWQSLVTLISTKKPTNAHNKIASKFLTIRITNFN